MEINQFLEKVKSAKKSQIYSGSNNLVIYSHIDNDLALEIREKKEKCVCSKCGTDLSKNPKSVKIRFNKSQEPLSVFQASLLFNLYIFNKLVYDYAQYHKCIAGKEFIENIKSIEVNN